MELGAGSGLPSLVAAALGAEHVVATDYDHFAVKSMAVASTRNGLDGRVLAAHLDWAHRDEHLVGAYGPWPVILAADVNYTTSAVAPLVATIDDDAEHSTSLWDDALSDFVIRMGRQCYMLYSNNFRVILQSSC